MSGRRTNLALLVLLGGAVLTGVLAFAVGTKIGVVFVVAHGIAGLGILVLAPWKTTIAERGMRKRRPGRVVSMLLAAFAALAVVSGLMQSTGLVLEVGPLTTMQIHVGSAVVASALTITHVVKRRVRPRRVDLARRNLLRAAGLFGVAGAAYLIVEGSMRVLRLPGSDRRFTGSHEAGSFDPTRMPVTQWLDDTVPRIDGSSDTVDVQGRLVAVDEIASYGDRVVATLDCTGGWFSTQEWSGASLGRLLTDRNDGRSVLVRSVTGYARRFPLEAAAQLLLATHVGGEPLSRGHGSPVRLVAPGRRGFWWVKWVVEVRVDSRSSWWQLPFPLT